LLLVDVALPLFRRARHKVEVAGGTVLAIITGAPSRTDFPIHSVRYPRIIDVSQSQRRSLPIRDSDDFTADIDDALGDSCMEIEIAVAFGFV
jgi:hypothetical protein